MNYGKITAETTKLIGGLNAVTYLNAGGSVVIELPFAPDDNDASELCSAISLTLSDQAELFPDREKRDAETGRYIGQAYYFMDSEDTSIFVLYIADYQDIINFFDVRTHVPDDRGPIERRFDDFTVIFYNDSSQLRTDFPTSFEVGAVYLHLAGIYIDFGGYNLLSHEPLFTTVFGTPPPAWLRTVSAMLSLKFMSMRTDDKHSMN